MYDEDETAPDKTTLDEAPYDDGPHQSTDERAEYFAEAESIETESSADEHGNGSVFNNSRDFTVSGGVFSSKVINKFYSYPRKDIVDFRRIPLGDVYLREELHSAVAYVSESRHYMRRAYSATVDHSSNMTVAVYHGKPTKKAWRTDLSNNCSLRDPRFVQVFGTVRSNGIYATVYYDDLIPFWPFFERQSPILSVYIYALALSEYTEASEYYRSVSGGHPLWEFLLWVKPSTRRLSFELCHLHFTGMIIPDLPKRIISDLTILDAETEVTRLMSLNSFHETLNLMFLRYEPTPFVSPVSLGSFVHRTELRTVASVVYSTGPRVHSEHVQSTKTMPNGWARVASENWCWLSECGSITRRHKNQIFRYTFTLGSSDLVHAWLSQANYICNRLQITPELADNLVVIARIEFSLTVSYCPPEGAYLFICPSSDFYVGPTTYWWPECPAYWSFDPSGVNRLLVDDAKKLGLPLLQQKSYVLGYRWENSLYEGLQQFHQAKGFDPYSQDVARHLGHPLYELVDDRFEVAAEDCDNGLDAGEQGGSKSEDEDEIGAVENRIASNSKGSGWTAVKDAVDSLAKLSTLAGIQIGAQQIDFLGFVV